MVKVGVAGLGAIGSEVVQRIAGGLDGFTLSAVCSRTIKTASAVLKQANCDAPIVDAGELARLSDVVVEAVPAAAFLEVVQPAITLGRTIVTVSGGALLAHPEVVNDARKHRSRIVLATGALLGLDAVRAAAQGKIRSVRMVTRKPPKSLEGAPFLTLNGISLDGLTEAKKLFDGSARDGCKGFPANVNVAAALGLAGIGADETKLEIWADPALDRNTHTISVESDSANFTMTIENVPSAANAGTGRITAKSVIAALRSLSDTLRVGS